MHINGKIHYIVVSADNEFGVTMNLPSKKKFKTEKFYKTYDTLTKLKFVSSNF